MALEEGELITAINSCTAEIGQSSDDKSGEGQIEDYSCHCSVLVF